VKQINISPHGPKIGDVGDDTPSIVKIIWALCIITWCITFLIYFRQRRKLKSQPFTALRDSYLQIVAFPLVIGSFSLACVFSVRPAFVWELFQHMYEAFTLLAFSHVLLALLGHDSHVIVTTLQKSPPVKIYSAPPFLCFLECCTSPAHLTAFGVDLSYFLIYQYIYIVPLQGFFVLWLYLDGNQVSPVPNIFAIISMLFALQGLFILFRATRSALADYQPWRKFLSIKAIVLVGIVQKLIISEIVPTYAEVGAYDREALVSLWVAFVYMLECPLFALALTYAFPMEELIRYHDNKPNKEDVEMDNNPPVENSGMASTENVQGD